MSFDLMFRNKVGLGMSARVVRKAPPVGRLSNQSLQRGDKPRMILVNDLVA
jgi:hypothetical protein